MMAKRIGMVCLLSVLTAQLGPAQSLVTLHSFVAGTDGYRPESGLVLSGDTVYGTTIWGGVEGRGTIFTMKTNGTGFTVLHSTNTSDWMQPNALLLNGGTLYGTTASGDDGSGLGIGTVFKLNVDGSGYTVLKTFKDYDGKDPSAELVLGGNTLYGVTTSGGSNGGGGCLFKINTDGNGFAVIHSFLPPTSSNNVAADPVGGLILDGTTLYGTTMDGGAFRKGTVFKIETDGNGFAVIHDFQQPDACFPRARLVFDQGWLYGTTFAGGGSGYDGTVFKLNANGTGFEVLHRFPAGDSSSQGHGPWSPLILVGGTLCGSTAGVPGTVFKLRTDGSGFATLHDFADPNYQFPDGQLINAPVVFGGSCLYGVATVGGSASGGTIFSLTLPSPTPIVLSNPGQNNGRFSFGWNADVGSRYQVQYTTNLTTTDWQALGSEIVATNNTASFVDPTGTDVQRFYRVVLLP